MHTALIVDQYHYENCVSTKTLRNIRNNDTYHLLRRVVGPLYECLAFDRILYSWDEGDHGMKKFGLSGKVGMETLCLSVFSRLT